MQKYICWELISCIESKSNCSIPACPRDYSYSLGYMYFPVFPEGSRKPFCVMQVPLGAEIVLFQDMSNPEAQTLAWSEQKLRHEFYCHNLRHVNFDRISGPTRASSLTALTANIIREMKKFLCVFVYKRIFKPVFF